MVRGQVKVSDDDSFICEHRHAGKNRLGFSYDHGTEVAFRQAVASDLVETIAPERLRDELTTILQHSNRREALLDLDRLGILGRILPEFTAGQGVEQPPEFHAEGDVWTHQLLVLAALPDQPPAELVWGALLHDIGKPLTQSRREKDGRIMSIEHDKVGAQLAQSILRDRFKFSHKQIEQSSG